MFAVLERHSGGFSWNSFASFVHNFENFSRLASDVAQEVHNELGHQISPRYLLKRIKIDWSSQIILSFFNICSNIILKYRILKKIETRILGRPWTSQFRFNSFQFWIIFSQCSKMLIIVWDTVCSYGFLSLLKWTFLNWLVHIFLICTSWFCLLIYVLPVNRTLEEVSVEVFVFRFEFRFRIKFFWKFARSWLKRRHRIDLRYRLDILENFAIIAKFQFSCWRLALPIDYGAPSFTFKNRPNYFFLLPIVIMIQPLHIPEWLDPIDV